MAPRWRQDGPNRAPRRAQDGSKSHLIAILCCIIFVWLRIARPRPPKTARGTPRDPPGTSRDPPGRAQDGSEKAPKWPQHCNNKRRVDHILLPSEWGWPVMRRRRSRSAAPCRRQGGRGVLDHLQILQTPLLLLLRKLRLLQRSRILQGRARNARVYPLDGRVYCPHPPRPPQSPTR